jgi:hypothetical protein
MWAGSRAPGIYLPDDESATPLVKANQAGGVVPDH